MKGGLASVVDPERVLSAGGGRSEYSNKLFATYGFPTPELKSLRELAVTAGWAAAVTSVQNQLLEGRLRLPPHKPALVLSTAADEVLRADDISSRSPLLCSSPRWADGPAFTSRDAGLGGDGGNDGGGSGGRGGGVSTAAGRDAPGVKVPDPLSRPIWAGGVVERRVGTSPEAPSAHDVLAAPSAQRVDEAMNHIERWLSCHFPAH